jgi:erythromycin esterase-like protein
MSDTEAVNDARRTYERIVRDNLTTYAARLPQPPSPAAVTDLWAHARHIRDDGTEAARVVRQVLDLGWRPAEFGGDDA